MPQTVSAQQLREFLAQTPPFDRLSAANFDWLMTKCQLFQYRMGQAMLSREVMPDRAIAIFEGQARLLGFTAGGIPVSLGVLGPGKLLGWGSLMRGVPCETATAAQETVAVTILQADFLELMRREPSLQPVFGDRPSYCEAYELVVAELHRRADGATDAKAAAARVSEEGIILTLPKGEFGKERLDPNLVWLVSAGEVEGFAQGSRLDMGRDRYTALSDKVRLLGFRDMLDEAKSVTAEVMEGGIPYAPELTRPTTDQEVAAGTAKRYPFFRGRGPIDGLLACLQMLGKFMEVPFKRDLIQRILEGQVRATGTISMPVCGALVETIGLSGQLVQIPTTALTRLKGTALIPWQDSFAVLYKIEENEVVFASPQGPGVQRKKLDYFIANCPEQIQALFVKPPVSRVEKFGLHTFIPYVQKHSGILVQVLVASFFILLFSLATPLITQVIIDKVLIQRSVATLDVLGWLLVIIALLEGVLTWLRTYLFVDTTNRIDLSLGSEIIDHLLRLPLNYFDRRRVGEVSTRIGELENIRSFMTGTALTVVMDVIFSVVYILIMFAYNWQLTLWALVTVPFFMGLALVASPLIRRQLRRKAERNADTQSYLVEVLSGVQTVKAQNIELKSRWQWQEKYARYVNAGFQTVMTSSFASAASTFLNHLSSLLVLWVGAHLVLNGDLTLGQLIAFRIISSYVTSPLLRLAQLWQNFQEIGLSIERLSDIMDAEQEISAEDRTNIPMPAIEGSVKFEEVSFRFGKDGPLQLVNISLDFPAGTFVGIVGQSGSGKSTLTKLISRLYDPLQGRIQIDNYDIGKVELYSLRRQIGIVLQDSLLFNSTVQENIGLANPDASADEIVEAAKIAAAHDFIMSLPQGYNTVVGERGAGLSGGQRQRIAIARTVLQRPRILILDEATSALDYDSERQVCQNLAAEFHDRTIFFITHRLNTIKGADVILMMDKGSVVEMGTHPELMALKGRYYCLFMQQESQM
ncbi:MAG TPA: type I secretion system permease/ATPase [Cyanobacteria bacterium UBA8156]|jgi:ATP-binding cassette subfamily B protein|nr:type I secretion system permease/ATPase [Cyanobacteria bacterium UBA8156]